MRKFPANSFVTRSQFGFGGGAWTRCGQIIDKGAETADIFYSSIQPLLLSCLLLLLNVKAWPMC